MAKEDIERQRAREGRRKTLRKGVAPILPRKSTPQELIARAQPIAALNRQIASAQARIAQKERDIQEARRLVGVSEDADVRSRLDSLKREVTVDLKAAEEEGDHDAVVDEYNEAVAEFTELGDRDRELNETYQSDLSADFLGKASAEEIKVMKELEAQEETLIAEMQRLEVERHDRDVAAQLNAMPFVPVARPHVHVDGACACQVSEQQQ